MIPVEDLRAYLGQIEEDDTATNDLLEELEIAAVDQVERATRTYFGPVVDVEYFLNGTGCGSLFVPDEMPTITEILVRYQPDPTVGFVTPATTLTTADYVRRGREIIRRDGLAFPLGNANIEVTGTRGFEYGAEPPVIRQLVKDLVNWQYRTGRKLSLEAAGAPDLGQVPGFEQVVRQFRRPLYGG